MFQSHAQKKLEMLLSGTDPDDLLPPVHPGQILLHDFLELWDMTPYRLAKLMGVQQTRVAQILKGQRGITADTAVRLSRAIGCSPEFWMGLQTQHDLEVALRANAAEYGSLARYEHADAERAELEDVAA